MEKCYICLTDTENKSNCECKSFICKECLIKEVEYRNGKCSICKKNIEDIEIFISEINKKKEKKNNIELAKCIFYIFLILFFIFVAGNLYLNFISKSFKVYFNGTVFIYGFLFYILTILSSLLSYGLFVVSYIFFEFLFNLLNKIKNFFINNLKINS